MTTWIPRVHFGSDGQSRCSRGRQLTTDRDAVTCQTCLNLLDGIHGVGNRRYDPEPCGTPAAYRRHLRHQGKPVRCESCLQAERRRFADLRRAA